MNAKIKCSELKVKIAGKFTVADWKALNEKLNIGEKDNWELAYKVFFLTRLETRYFEPIRLLQKHGDKKGEGFAIVALQCSLIEFLASTLNGKIYKHRPPSKCKECDKSIIPSNGCDNDEYSSSAPLFIKFLHTATPFNKYFDEKTAKDFYKNVRCALLHEARTKGGWKILSESISDCVIYKNEENETIVDRDNLQSTFEEFVRWYGENLPQCDELQKAFKIKFESLCRE